MSSMNPVAPTVEPVVRTLRVVDGRRLQDAAPCAVALDTPSQAARARRGERLFLLLDVTGPVSSHLYRELREVLAQTYWSAAGSTTAALRLAAAAANRHLLQINRRSIPSDQCHGGLVCAVLRDEDLFILRVGPACACFFHEGRLRRFSREEELAPLGMGAPADACLHHAYVVSGAKLLLASPALARVTDDASLVRVLTRVGAERVLEGLEQVGAEADFSAMVVRWPLPGEALAAQEAPPSVSSLKTSAGRRAERSTKPRRFAWWRRRDQGPVEPEPPRPFPPLKPDVDEIALASAEPTEPPPSELDPASVFAERAYSLPTTRTDSVEPWEPPPSEPGPRAGERIGDGVRSAGRGIAAAGGAVVGGATTLFRRMLPDLRRRGRRRERSLRSPVSRPVPQENRTAMMALAIGIPIVLAITVTLAYRSLGADARFRGLIKQAEDAASSAQAASTPELSRSHWEAALEHAAAAVELRPDDQVATALQAQAQVALDSLDHVVRLHPVLLTDFGAGTVPRRLILHGHMVFVLDPGGGWVSRLTLNQAGDGVLEPEAASIVKKGQPVGEGVVGDLVDLVWVDLAGGRQTSGLLILEQDGALVSHDPAWEGEGGTLQLQRSFLGMPPESPKVVDTYDGRLYILDTVVNQVRRYEPRGDTYPERPDHYFVVPPPTPLADVVDMAIDGYIYLLYADGAIFKFLRGDPASFDVRGLPGDLSQAVALAVDPDSGSGVVYVADRGNGRVVALGPDGEFLSQFYAGEAFDMLEDLAVDEAMQRMVVISGGRLYVASLP
jgi:hypothetical protein